MISFQDRQVCAQNATIDSLMKKLESEKIDAAKLELFLKIAKNYRRSNTDSAIYYAESGFNLAKSMSDTLRMAMFYNQLGNIYKNMSDFENAMSFHLKALEFREKINDKKGIAQSLNNLGVVNFIDKNYDKAMDYYQQSLKFKEQLQDTLAMSFSYNNIATIYSIEKKYKLALEYFEKSLVIKLLFETNGIAATYNNIGLALQKMGDYKSSEEYYLLSYEYCERRNLMFDMGTAAINLGVVSNLLDKPRVAEMYFDQAYDLALKNGYKKLMIEATSFSQEFYAEQGRFKEAHEMLILNIIYNDSVKNDDVIKKIAKLEAEHEFNQQQVADSIVRYQQKIRNDAIYDEEIKRKEQLLWILAITFVFIIFVIFILFKAYQLKKKNHANLLQQRTLEIEKNLLRTQMNPHFIFNAMNSIQSFIATNDTYSAERYLSKFAKLIRLILENSMHQTILLSEEILSLQLYLDLEKVRFNSKFEFSIDIDNEVEDEMINVPPMLIQPFVENAIIHGIMHKIGTGNITISIVESDMPKTLKCEIVDDGIGRQAAKNLKLNNNGKKHKSVGMQLTRERLEALNSQTQPAMSYEIEDVCDKDKLITGTKVTLYIPYFEHNI